MVTKNILEEYAKIFLKTWDSHFEGSGIYYTVTLYPNIKDKYAAILIELSFEKPETDDFIIVESYQNDLLRTDDENILIKPVDTLQVEFTDHVIAVIKPINKENWGIEAAETDSIIVVGKVLKAAAKVV